MYVTYSSMEKFYYKNILLLTYCFQMNRNVFQLILISLINKQKFIALDGGFSFFIESPQYW